MDRCEIVHTRIRQQIVLVYVNVIHITHNVLQKRNQNRFDIILFLQF